MVKNKQKIGSDTKIYGELEIDGLTVTDNNLKSKVLVLNNNGKLSGTNISQSELGMLDNVRSNIQNQIDTEKQTRQSEHEDIRTSLSEEESARASGDSTLQSNIDSEASTRESEDEALGTRIDDVTDALEEFESNTTDALATKRDKINSPHTYPVAYVQGTDGTEGMVSIVSGDSTAGTIVARTSTGTIKTATPIADADSATKKYVDDADSATKKYVDDSDSEIKDDLDTHISDTDNPHEVTKAQVGLGSVINQGMDDAPVADSIRYVTSGGVQSAIQTVVDSLNEHVEDTSNPHNVTKSQVGLGNVDNTSDLNKPVSTAQNQAIQSVSDELDSHTSNTNNPHNVTKSQVGLGNVDNTSDLNKPVSTAQNTAIQQVQTNLNTHIGTNASSDGYGHVKFDTQIGNNDRTDVAISEAGIKEFVNSSVSTATANFLGTYDAVIELGISQALVDTFTYSPSVDVQNTVANAIATTLASETVTLNDYVFVKVNQSTTIDEDWYWRFKYGSDEWLYEYTLNNSSFTQSQWASINSGINEDKVESYDSHLSDTDNPHNVTKAQVGLGNVVNKGMDTTPTANSDNYVASGGVKTSIDGVQSNLDTHVNNKSNPHNVTKSQVGLGNVDNTSDANKPISTATQSALDNKIDSVNQTGSGYVTSISINTTDKTQLDVTRSDIPNLTKGTTIGSGNVVTDISVSKHKITLSKGITALTEHQDISGKANVNLDNVSGISQTYAGKALMVSASGGLEFGESGKIDIVKVNGTELTVTDKSVDIPVPTSVDGLGGGTITSAVTVSGNITGQYVTGTWLRTSSATNLNNVPSEYPVLSSGWIYKRTRAQMRTDLEIPTKVTELSDAGNYALKSDLADAGDKHTISDTAPESPHDGDIWFDTSNQGSTPTGLSRYLPLYGGTITGVLNVNGRFTANSDADFKGGVFTTGAYHFVDSERNIKAYIGYDPSLKNCYITNTDGDLLLFASGKNVHVQDPTADAPADTIPNLGWISATGTTKQNTLLHENESTKCKLVLNGNDSEQTFVVQSTNLTRGYTGPYAYYGAILHFTDKNGFPLCGLRAVTSGTGQSVLELVMYSANGTPKIIEIGRSA